MRPLAALTDDDVARLSPMMRGLLAQRYEALHERCEIGMEGRNAERWAELDARVLAGMVKLWRLEAPARAGGEEESDDARRAVGEAARRRAIASVDQLAANLSA